MPDEPVLSLSFSERQLRTSSRIGWMYATAIYANSRRELREANLFGWFYATGGCGMGVDKAGFHAIAPIRSIDEQAALSVKKLVK